jgi:hypothetical protein
MPNRFTAPVKYQPGITIDLPVVVLSSTVNHKMGIYGAKFGHEIKDDELFDLQCKTIKQAFPKAEIVLGVGKDYHKANRSLKNKWAAQGVKMVENQLWQDTSETETLRLAMNVLPAASRMLVISGDVFFDKGALNFLSASQSTLSYYMDKNEDEIGLNFDISKSHKLSGTGYSLAAKWSNMMYVTGKELDTLRKFCLPKNSKLELWEFLQYAMKNSCEIICKQSPGKVIRAYNASKLEEITCVG